MCDGRRCQQEQVSLYLHIAHVCVCASRSLVFRTCVFVDGLFRLVANNTELLLDGVKRMQMLIGALPLIGCDCSFIWALMDVLNAF